MFKCRKDQIVQNARPFPLPIPEFHGHLHATTPSQLAHTTPFQSLWAARTSVVKSAYYIAQQTVQFVVPLISAIIK